MRKLLYAWRPLWLIVALLAGARSGPAQDISRLPGNAYAPAGNCFPTKSGATDRPAARTASAYNPNGYAVTPQGELHVLLVYAGFTQDINAAAPGYSGGDWPQDDGVHPTGESFPANNASLSYTSLSQFSPTATDPSFSNLYYQTTQFSPNPLKMILHTFPKRINIPANDITSAGSGAIAYTNLVLEALKNDPDTPNFDFSQVDKRTNHPDFQLDNSQTAPDGIVDFVIVVWRMATTGSPYQMGSINYAGGGFASLGNYDVTGIPQANGRTYKMLADDGFTQAYAQYGLTGLEHGVFTHEFLHCISQSPHYNTAHGVVGTHFYAGQGPGMMAGQVFSGATAWESWYNGWAELQASGDNTDIQDASSLTATNGLYTLRDFVTTGDMMRIRLPGSTQYLWLENHAGNSVLDNRYTLFQDGQTPAQDFPPPPRGLVALIEDITDDRNTLLSYSRGSNGLHTVSAQGSFDYQPSATTASYNRHLFGNLLYNFTNLRPNPFGGHNQTSSFRMDKNGDGIIYWEPGEGFNNESVILDVVNGQFDDGIVGPKIAFDKVGQKMGISYNPAIFEHQRYDGDENNNGANARLSTIELNGLSVKITGRTTGPHPSLTIQVRYDDVDVVQNTRWTGDLLLTDVRPGPDADVHVTGADTLTIDRSGTANRHTPTAQGDFINPTRLFCPTGTTFAQDGGSTVRVRGANTTFGVLGTVQLLGSGNTFVVQDASLLEVHQNGVLEIAQGSKLVIAAGGSLVLYGGAIVKGAGRIEVQDGGHLCIENGVNWQVDPSFTLDVAPNASLGVNYALSPVPTANCAATLQNYCAVLAGGNPSLHRTCFSEVVAQPERAIASVTPNPAHDEATVVLTLAQAGEVRLSVQDMQGRPRLPTQALHLPAGSQALRLPLRELPAGVYLLIAEGANGRQVTRLQVDQ